MFKKSSRLHTSEFKEVFNFSKTIHTPLCIIKKRENTLTHPRFAVVVSKKISKRAVERNYLKRRFMNALKDTHKKPSSTDYVFILNSSVKDIQYKDLLNSLNEINL